MFVILLSTIREKYLEEVQNSVSAFRKVKSQLTATLELLKEGDGSSELIRTGEEALTSINMWEEKLIEPERKVFQDVINFENRLISELNILRMRADSYDPRISEGITLRVNELNDTWMELSQEQEEIISGPLASFNKLYKQEKIPAILIPEMK